MAKKVVYSFNEQGRRSWELVDDIVTSYEHPLTHPASMIEESNTKMFVTLEEKNSIGTGGGLTQPQILARNLGC